MQTVSQKIDAIIGCQRDFEVDSWCFEEITFLVWSTHHLLTTYYLLEPSFTVLEGKLFFSFLLIAPAAKKYKYVSWKFIILP